MQMMKSTSVNFSQSSIPSVNSTNITETWQVSGWKRFASHQEDSRSSTLMICRFPKKEDPFQFLKRNSTPEAKKMTTYSVIKRNKKRSKKATTKTRSLRQKNKTTSKGYATYARSQNAEFSVEVTARDLSMSNVRKKLNKKDSITLMTFQQNFRLRSYVWKMII
jgi:hypothetical protein